VIYWTFWRKPNVHKYDKEWCRHYLFLASPIIFGMVRLCWFSFPCSNSSFHVGYSIIRYRFVGRKMKTSGLELPFTLFYFEIILIKFKTPNYLLSIWFHP
jgi:hypothetical protein